MLSACAGERHSVSRLAGDEFTVILWPLTDPRREVSEFCENVLAQLATITQIGPQKVRLSASIGAAISPRGDVTEEMLLTRADGAMYQAKSAGKGTYAICEL